MQEISEQVTGSRCAIPTQSLGHCKRKPRYAYVCDHYRSAGPEVVATVCAQHASGVGAAALLLPPRWEYDRIVDLASGMTVRNAR